MGLSSVVSDPLQPHGLWPGRLLCLWDFPGRNTGVGCHFRLQGIFPTRGWNPGLLHCRRIIYHLSPQGSLVALAGWFFTTSATREAATWG